MCLECTIWRERGDYGPSYQTADVECELIQRNWMYMALYELHLIPTVPPKSILDLAELNMSVDGFYMTLTGLVSASQQDASSRAPQHSVLTAVQCCLLTQVPAV